MGDRSFRVSFSPQRHGSLECVNRKKQPVEKYERGTRSYTMSHIRGKDTKIEVLVRSYLFHEVAIPQERQALPRTPGCSTAENTTPSCLSTAVSGTCMKDVPNIRCRNRTWNSGRRNYCAITIETSRSEAELEAADWRVITVWECELTKAVRDERLARLYEQIVEGDADSAE